MAASARIDELRSKFEENPRRYFAPLANEYRKSGDLGTAIALLRTQLRLFPQHMSGHVVLGQALFEAGELDDARQVFERAVELDAENLIALRHLGDISRDLGDTERARSWYRRVLDVDPYNEQITEILDRLATPTSVAEPAQRSDVAGLTEIAVWPPPIELTPEAEARAEAEPQPAPDPSPEPAAGATPEFIDLAEDDFLAWAPPAAAEHGQPFAPAPELELEPLPDPTPEPPTAHRLDSVDAATFDPVVGLDLVPVHDEAFDQLEQLGDVEPRTASTSASAPDPESVAPDPWIPEEGAPLELVTSDAFATETMAELCLEQGHEEEALAIYDRLVAQRPDDSALAERARALRDRLHASTQPPPELAPEPAPAPAPEPAPVVDERDSWAADAWAGALRTDVPATEPLLPDLSFDRFFAGAEFVDEPVAAAPAAPAVPTPPASAAPVPAAPAPAAPAPEEEDLAEFNAWLKGLRDS